MQNSTISSARTPIVLPPLTAGSERQEGQLPHPTPNQQRVGFAVVGLGHLALGQILPAFAESKLAKPVALVSGNRDKVRSVALQYDICERSLYNYDNYDRILDNPDIQAVYIVLPNSMHAEFAIRGARAGKHVLTEKPMATNPRDCESMIEACREAKRLLMVAYRIQYEPTHWVAQRLTRSEVYGRTKLIDAVHVQNQGDPDQWRQKKALAGGGSLFDIGLYCLNTTRWLTGEEPVEVFAQMNSTPNDPRFRDVEENVSWQMRFPSGILASNSCSYGAHKNNRYCVNAESGWFGMDPAFAYDGLQMLTSHAVGEVEYRETPSLAPKNQFAQELDHMAQCILNGEKPYTPGEEGLQDHRIMEAIYESARVGQAVKLPVYKSLDTFRGKNPQALAGV